MKDVESQGEQQVQAALRAQLAERDARLADVTRDADMLIGRLAQELESVLQRVGEFGTALQRRAGEGLDERERHYVQRIVEAAAQGSSLVQGMLAYARVAHAPFSARPVPVGPVAERARAWAERQHPDDAVQWTMDASVTVLADSALLEQALALLFDNALKFTRGRDPRRVCVTARAADGWCELSVADNGAGFDPHYAGRLFTPGGRVHGQQEFPGAGMGLACVQRIVARMGGKVAAEAPPSGGACFTLRLPLPVDGAAAPAAGLPAQPGTPLRVLLVDDDPMVLLSLRQTLEALGHVVTVAHGGEAAIDELQRARQSGRPHEVLLTDFGMPRLHGGQVARAAKQADPSVVVLVLTGWGGQADSMREWAPHVDGWIDKPPRLARLREALTLAASLRSGGARGTTG